MMLIDQAGIDFIKEFEGLRLEVYLDGAGVPTQGYGHTQGVHLDSLPLQTEEEAEELLAEDLKPCQAAINKYVSVSLNQNEFNALCSFVFNEGIGRIISSTLVMKLNGGDRQGAAKEFDKWIYIHDPETGQMKPSDGLKYRRAMEKALFLTPSTTPNLFA